MKVWDYELLSNINMLYEAPIIIYGAGHRGKEVLKLLEEMETEICCFCDGDKTKQEYCGYEVVNIESIGEMCAAGDYTFVIASEFQFEDMIKELETRNISARYVFTEWSIEAALSYNLDNDKIPENFRISYEQKVLNNLDELNNNRHINKIHDYFDKHPQILVYQWGKVGSTSVHESLKKYNVACMHVHDFYNRIELNKDETPLLHKELQEQIKKGVKIISMVRDPISRHLSSTMQPPDFINYNVLGKRKSLKERMLGDLEGHSHAGCTYPWFHRELERLTGINVFEYPFDKEKGYTIIKEGKIEILLLTMEKLNDNEKVIGDFVGIKDFKLIRDNVGENKEYKYVYERVKAELQIPDELLDRYYFDQPQLEHFYTEEQIKKFRNKWKRG